MRVTAVAIAFVIILGVFIWVMTDAALPSSAAMTKLRMERIRQVFNAYAARTGAAPASLAELKAEDGKPLVIEDYWGRPIQLMRSESDSQKWLLLSLGADGQPGGSGENRDLQLEWTIDLEGAATQAASPVAPVSQPAASLPSTVPATQP